MKMVTDGAKLLKTDQFVLDKALDEAWAALTARGAPYEVGYTEIRGQMLRYYPNAPKTLAEFWASTASFGEDVYLVYNDERITYAQAHEITAAVANWLLEQGIRKGDRVAIAMRNYPEWLLVYWACLSIGVAVVGMNAWWVPEEMSNALEDSEPRAIFCDAERLARLEALNAHVPEIIVGVRTKEKEGLIPWQTVINTKGKVPAVEIAPDDDACIFFTSGTAGRAKGAELTHRSCISNFKNILFIIEAQEKALAEVMDLDTEGGVESQASGLVTTPLFHVTANNCLAHILTAVGGKVVLMYKWDATKALEIVEAEGIMTLSGVPTMSRELINHPDIGNYDLSSLTTLSGGGAQMPPDLVARIDSYNFNASPSTGFGLTEVSGVVAAFSGEFFVGRPESCGRAMPTIEVKVVDDEGATLPAGGVGELYVKGTNVVKGYLNRPEATAEAIVDGWLKTGDIARIDEQGFIYIMDRKKDMILRGGENVYCTEVEAALFHHPDVMEACAFGVDDERLGEEVGAALVLKEGSRVTVGDLHIYVSTRIARHKIPRYFWFLNKPLPRNASGKFLRKDLKSSLNIDASLSAANPLSLEP